MDKQTFLREALSKEYPRLDVRVGTAHAAPWTPPASEEIQIRGADGEWVNLNA